MITIEDLRRMAELNLCENCFKNYKMLIEPTIRDWLSNPLSDWSEVELHITQMVMKTKGFFKGKLIFNSLDEDSNEKLSDKIDVKDFKATKKWSFKWKIDYLHKKGILNISSYKVLDTAREARNKIHDPYAPYSEHDRTLFHIANVITNQIWCATIIEMGEDTSNNLKSEAEKMSEQYLDNLNY
jgi:hypothetical protein